MCVKWTVAFFYNCDHSCLFAYFGNSIVCILFCFLFLLITVFCLQATIALCTIVAWTTSPSALSHAPGQTRWQTDNPIIRYRLLRPREQWQSIVMSTSVCLSVCEHISGITHAIFTKLFVHVAYGCGSVLRRGDAVPRWRGNFWVFIPPTVHCQWLTLTTNPYSSMNFATKDRFGLNLLIYCKVRQNLISYY